MEKKAVIYTRVSTDEQKEKGFSLQDQEARLRKYCLHNNISVEKHYQDDHSAKDFNRPQFQQFLKDINEKKIKPNIFLCVRTDRFSRNAAASMLMIEQLRKLGIEFMLLEGQYDLEIPENHIPFQLNMIMAQVDNMRRSKNTRDGMRQAMKEGCWTGTAPFGYSHKRNESNRSTLIPNEKSIYVKQAFKEIAETQCSIETARKNFIKKGHKLSKQGFINLIKNVAYIGKILIPSWKEEESKIVEGLHEPLISEDEFFLVQDIIKGRKKRFNKELKSNNLLPLRGFLICSKCGGNLTGSGSKSRNGVKHYYYHCQKGCKERFRADESNKNFITYLNEISIKKEIMVLYYKIMEDIFKEKEGDRAFTISKISGEIDKLSQSIEMAQDKLLDGTLDSASYYEIKQRYLNKINILKAEKLTLETTDTEFMQYVKYGFPLLSNLDFFYKSAPYHAREKLVCSIFPNKLTYSNKKYRTHQKNEVLALLSSKDKELKGIKNKQVDKNADPSTRALPAGLEPATL